MSDLLSKHRFLAANALHQAIDRKDMATLRELLADPRLMPSVEAATRVGVHHQGPAAFAAHSDWPDGIQALADAGADLDLRDAGGRPALCTAIQARVEQAVRKLANLGADLSIRDNAGNTALHWALSHHHMPMIDLVASLRPWADSFNADGQSCMMIASTRGSLDALQALAGLGFETDQPNARGITPLWTAISASTGLNHCARWLLGRGAQPDRMGPDGWTPLKIAIMNDSLALAEALIRAGANIHLRPPSPEAPENARSAFELAQGLRGKPAADAVLSWGAAVALRSELAAASQEPAARAGLRPRAPL